MDNKDNKTEEIKVELRSDDFKKWHVNVMDILIEFNGKNSNNLNKLCVINMINIWLSL